MSLFGSLLKTGFDIVTLPVDIAHDVITLGGALTEEDSAVANKAAKLLDDADDISDDLGDL
jgi:hypothetical protein